MDSAAPDSGLTRRARAGGQAILAQRGPEYFRALGQRGGRAVSQDKAHMARIGQRGGLRRGRARSGEA